MNNADYETGVPVPKKKKDGIGMLSDFFGELFERAANEPKPTQKATTGKCFLVLDKDGLRLEGEDDPLPYARSLDHHATSKDAALRLAPKAGSIRRIILDELIAHGPGTRQELTERTGLGYQTVTGGSGVWWLCRNGWAVIEGTRDGEGIVAWSGQRPDIIG